MLYGIEERPTYKVHFYINIKMVDTFYFGLHLINHFQYISMII